MATTWWAAPFHCPYCGATVGTNGLACKCDDPECGWRSLCPEVYTRVVGYLRPTRNFHAAKKLEFRQRKTYNVAAALAHKRMEEGNEPTD